MGSTEAGSPEAGTADAVNPLTPAFAQFAKEQLESWKVPGISVGVVDGGATFTEVRALHGISRR